MVTGITETRPEVVHFLAMGLCIDFGGLWDVQTQEHIEDTIRTCIGDPPVGHEWSVLITSYGGFCVVLIKTTEQTRRKLFLLPAAELADAIPPWLDLYPLR